MTTLNLTKKGNGYYEIKSGNTYLSVTNAQISAGLGSNKWQFSVIENNLTLAKEFFNTKKEAVNFGTKWVINNL
jgi:hypothetical protein